MELIPLTCAQCDAPIRVEEGQKSVVCEHCETQLLIQKSAETLRTEIVDEILRRTDHLAQEVKALKAERRIKTLDQRWRRHRRRLAQSSETNQNPLPGIAIMSLVGIVYLLASELWLLGIVALGLASAIIYAVARRRMDAEKARQSYRRRRRRLMARLRKAADPPGHAE